MPFWWASDPERVKWEKKMNGRINNFSWLKGVVYMSTVSDIKHNSFLNPESVLQFPFLALFLLTGLLKIHPHDHKSSINLAYIILIALHCIRRLHFRWLQIITCSVYSSTLLYDCKIYSVGMTDCGCSLSALESLPAIWWRKIDALAGISTELKGVCLCGCC